MRFKASVMNMFNHLSVSLIALAFLVFATASYCDQETPVSNSNKNGEPAATIKEGVKGRVTTARGRPIKDAFIQPASLDEPGKPIPELAIVTDEDGRYEWRLFPGDYMISVSADGYKTASKKVTVEADQAATLDFTLKRAP